MSASLIPVSAEHFESLPEHVRHMFQVIQNPDSESAKDNSDSQSVSEPASVFANPNPVLTETVPASITNPVPDSAPSESSLSALSGSDDAVMESGDSKNPVSGKSYLFSFLLFSFDIWLTCMSEPTPPPTTPSPVPAIPEEVTPRPEYESRRIRPEPLRRPPGKRKSSWLFLYFSMLIRSTGYDKVEVVMNQVFDAQRKEAARSGRFSVASM